MVFGHIRALIIPVLLILLCSLLLWRDFSQSADPGQGKPIAFTKISMGDVKRKPLSRLVWFDSPTLQPLYRKDSIRTASGAKTIIELINGTVIELSENSLIVLEESRGGGFAVDFVSGSLLARGSGKGLTLKSKGVSIDAGQASVALQTQANGGQTTLNVVEGKAAVKTDSGDRVEIGQNQTTELSAKSVGEVKTLPAQLVAPAHSTAWSGKRARSQRLEWEALRDFKSGRLQIASDPQFLSVLREVAIHSTKKGQSMHSAVPPFEPGTYYWRVVAEDLPTETRTFQLLSDEPLRLVEPVPGRTYKYVKRVPKVFYEWQAPTHLDQFEIQFSRSAKFEGVFFSEKVQNPLSPLGLGSVAIEKDFDGKVFWRIHGKSSALGIEDTSPSWPLEFSRSAELASADPLFPTANTQLELPKSGSLQVPIRWRQDPEASQYLVEIAADSGFLKPTLSQRTPLPPLAWSTTESASRFFWRVTAIDHEGNAAAPSPAIPFEIIAHREPASLAQTLPAPLPSPLPSELLGEPEPPSKPTPVAAASEPSPLPAPQPPEQQPEPPKPQPAKPVAKVQIPAKVEAPPPPEELDANIQKAPEVLAAPERLSPSGLIALPGPGESVPFKWKPVLGATRYRVRLWRASPSSTRSPAASEIPPQKEQLTQDARVQFAGLETGAYRWEVEALSDGNLNSSRSETTVELAPPSDPELKTASFWLAASLWSPYGYGTSSGVAFSSAAAASSGSFFLLQGEFRATPRWSALLTLGREQFRIGGTDVGLQSGRIEAARKWSLGVSAVPEMGWEFEVRGGAFMRQLYQAQIAVGPLPGTYGVFGPSIGAALKRRFNSRLSAKAEIEYRLPVMTLGAFPGSAVSLENAYLNFAVRLGGTYWIWDHWGIRLGAHYESTASGYQAIPGAGLGSETVQLGGLGLYYGITARF